MSELKIDEVKCWRHPLNKETAAEEESYKMAYKSLFLIPISSLDISVRAMNSLKISEIKVLGQLLTFKKNDFRQIRSVGNITITELTELLFEKYNIVWK